MGDECHCRYYGIAFDCNSDSSLFFIGQLHSLKKIFDASEQFSSAETQTMTRTAIILLLARGNVAYANMICVFNFE
jgi:hypothetical protein